MKTSNTLARPAFLIIALSLGLAACSGGGGGRKSQNPPPPADTTPPDTTLSTTPPVLANSATATFAFTASEAGSTFESRVDGAAYAAATSPQNLATLAEGSHTFDVRAKDAAGNVDATPATYTWTVDTLAPTASVLFPTPVSYTDAATVTVRGTASDANPITSVRVNGVLASTATSFNSWRVSVPVTAGNNTLTVSVTDAAANTNATAASVSVANRGPMMVWSQGAAYDAARDRIVITDQEIGSLLAYAVAGGNGVKLADFTLTSSNTALGDVVVDAANNRAIVLDWGQDALFAVNLDTGARTTLSQGNGSLQTSLILGFGLAHDPTNNRAFVTVRGSNVIIAVNLANGTRSVVSSLTVGTGTPFGNPLGIAYDATANRLLVADAPGTGAAIYSVDVATGNRVVLSQSPGTGSGPAMPGPTAIVLNAPNDLYVQDTSSNSVLRIDLASGNRTELAGAGTGTGPVLKMRPGLALRPANGHLFVPQIDGDVIEIDAGTLARTTSVSARVGPGLRLDHPQTVLAEQTGGAITSLLFGEPETQRLVRLDIATGQRTVVSDSVTGSGPGLGRLADFVLDTRAPANGRSIFGLVGAPGSSLISVDIATGNRQTLTTLTANLQPRNLRLDAAGNRLFYTNNDFNGTTSGLYSITLPGLVQSVVSSPAAGSGPAFGSPTTFILDPATNPTRALIADINPSAWRAVDLASGARSTFASIGVDPTLNLMGTFFHDAPNSQVYGINIYPPHLYVSTITPAGGESNRTLVSGQRPGVMTITGTGPLVDFGSGLCVDTARGVAFVIDQNAGALLAIDLASGDRVVIAR